MYSLPWSRLHYAYNSFTNSIVPAIHLLIACTYYLEGVVVCLFLWPDVCYTIVLVQEARMAHALFPRRLGRELRTLLTKKTAEIVEPNRTYSNPMGTAPTFWEYITRS